MKTQSSLLIAMSLALAACNDTSVQSQQSAATGMCFAHVVDGMLAVHIVEAEAGG